MLEINILVENYVVHHVELEMARPTVQDLRDAFCAQHPTYELSPDRRFFYSPPMSFDKMFLRPEDDLLSCGVCFAGLICLEKRREKRKIPFGLIFQRLEVVFLFLIVPIFYWFANLIYGTRYAADTMQSLSFWMFMTNTLIRELFTVLSSFDEQSKLIARHLWVVAAALTGYVVFHPDNYFPTDPRLLFSTFSLWLIFVVSGLIMRVNLLPRNERLIQLTDLLSWVAYYNFVGYVAALPLSVAAVMLLSEAPEEAPTEATPAPAPKTAALSVQTNGIEASPSLPSPVNGNAGSPRKQTIRVEGFDGPSSSSSSSIYVAKLTPPSVTVSEAAEVSPVLTKEVLAKHEAQWNASETVSAPNSNKNKSGSSVSPKANGSENAQHQHQQQQQQQQASISNVASAGRSSPINVRSSPASSSSSSSSGRKYANANDHPGSTPSNHSNSLKLYSSLPHDALSRTYGASLNSAGNNLFGTTPSIFGTTPNIFGTTPNYFGTSPNVKYESFTASRGHSSSFYSDCSNASRNASQAFDPETADSEITADPNYIVPPREGGAGADVVPAPRSGSFVEVIDMMNDASGSLLKSSSSVAAFS